MRLMAMALTSNAQITDTTAAAAPPNSKSATPNNATVVAAPTVAFGSLSAVSSDIPRPSGAMRFHAAARSTLPHIASFISIGCSALALK
jgi:hypothetical protein